MSANEFDVKRIFNIVFKRKFVVFGCIIALMVPAYLINKYSLPVYSAKTKIVFDQSRGGRKITESYTVTSENVIVNQIEEIQSRSMAREIALSLPDSLLPEFVFPEERGPDFDELEFLTATIKSGVSATSIQGSDVIKIVANSRSPKTSMYIANKITDILIKRNLELIGQETSNVRSIIEENLARYKRDLDEAEYKLREYKEENKLTEISQQGAEILRRITEAENQLNQTITSLDSKREQLNFISKRLAEERKDLVPAVTKTTSTRAQRLREELINLEDQYTKLSVQDYSDDHPEMVRLRTQINEIKNNLRDESLRIASGETTIDPLSQIQRFIEESVTLDIDIKAGEAQKKALEEVIANYDQQLKTMPSKELRLAQLMREKAVSEEIYTMLSSKREEAKIAEAEISGNIRVIDRAILPETPIRPRKMLNLMVGFILGASAGLGLAFVLDFFDDKISKTDQAEKISELPVIGTVPEIKVPLTQKPGKLINKYIYRKPGQSKLDLITLHEPQSPESESFRSLRTNLNISEFNTALKVILVTSGNPNEGKSLIIANLGVTLAQMGLRTLLIDADLRKPVQHFVFEKKQDPGLSELIASHKKVKAQSRPQSVTGAERPLREIIGVPEIFDFEDESEPPSLQYSTRPNSDNGQVVDFTNNGEYTLNNTIVDSGIENLDLLPCGELPKYPSEILGSRAMKNLLLSLRESYDVILIDTPPINVVTDAGILGSIVDGTMLVIKSGVTSQKDLLKAKNLLKNSNTKITGLVFNYINPNDSYSSYYYSYFNTSKKKVHNHS